MNLRDRYKDITDNDKVLISMVITILLVTMVFLPIRYFQGDMKLVFSNAFAMANMLTISTLFIFQLYALARYVFATFLGVMMILLIAFNGPQQINWVFCGMAMIFLTINSLPALIYSQTIGLLISATLYNQISLSQWLQQIGSLNILMGLIYYGSLVKERYNKKLEMIALENERAADIDALTKLQNRRAFDKAISSVLTDRRSKSKKDALIYIDIDHFKSVNDTYGHGVGDEALILTAKIMEDSLRDSEAYRYGGEEFVGLITNTTEKNALMVAERLRSNIENDFEYPLEFYVGESRAKLKITVSVGVALLEGDDTAEGWKEKADKALYTSKESGRNKVTLYRHLNSTGDEQHAA